VSFRAIRTALVAVVITAAAATTATAAAAPPTAQQIKTALKTATGSKQLWATINTCSDHVIGIRGQMPTLGFPARMEMVVTLSEWSPSANRYVPVPGRHTLQMGIHSTGANVQAGVSFSWKQPVTITAAVTFEWSRNHKLLGSASRVSSAGHKNAGGAKPKGYSAAACSLH
jgi:hypothetical protein